MFSFPFTKACLAAVALAACAWGQAPGVGGGAAGGYGGPGVLSRGAAGIGRRGGQLANLRFFASAQATYDNGFIPFQIDENGQVKSLGTLTGGEVAVGLYGGKSWRRSLAGIDYTGAYSRYSGNTFLNGFIHNLSFGVAHQFNRQFSVDSQTAAGTTNRGVGFFGGAAGVGGAGSPLIGGPTTFIFDNRTYFLQNQTTFVYQPNNRWFVAAGGNGFTVQRVSKALVDVNGYSLQAQAGRRLSRHTVVGGSYYFMHFDFPNAFGESDIHGAAGTYKTRLGRRWDLNASAGLFRARTIGLQTAALDPVIAALLGQSTVIRVFDRTVTLPTFQVAVTGNFRKKIFNAAYDRSAMPGNGVFLTSQTESASAGFQYLGVSRLSLTASGSYARMASLGPAFNPLAQGFAGGGLNYRIFRSLHANLRYDVRRMLTEQSTFRRTSQRVTVGLVYSPGEIPFAFR